MNERPLTQSANRSSLILLVMLLVLLGVWLVLPRAPERQGSLGNHEVITIGPGQEVRTEREYEGIVTLLIHGTIESSDLLIQDAFYLIDRSKPGAVPANDPLYIDDEPPPYLPEYTDTNQYLLRYAIDADRFHSGPRYLRFSLDELEGQGSLEITILPGDVQ